MSTYTHYESTAGRIAVRFISYYRGRSDYGLTLCCANKGEARISVDDRGEVMPHTFAADMPLDYGFTFEEAARITKRFCDERFDDDVRYIVERDLLANAGEDVRRRAMQLGLTA